MLLSITEILSFEEDISCSFNKKEAKQAGYIHHTQWYS